MANYPVIKVAPATCPAREAIRIFLHVLTDAKCISIPTDRNVPDTHLYYSSLRKYTMLRRPPTSISLSNQDVKEHLEHINQRKTQDWENVQPEFGQHFLQLHTPVNYTVSTENPCHDDDWSQDIAQTASFSPVVHRERGLLQGDPTGGPESSQTGSLPGSGSHSQRNIADRVVHRFPQPSIISNRADAGLYRGTEVEDGNILICLEEPPESPKCQSPSRHQEHSGESPSSRNTFEYGGFVEISINNSQSLALEDVSPPQNSPLPETSRIGSKGPSPLSQHTQSQGVSSSDKVNTPGLTPRIVSYGAQEPLLPQSQRRRKSYRPRTISYSFEESERASAAYEDIQGSDEDSNSSRPRPVERLSLREELRGSSLQSASEGSINPASPPEFANSQRSASTTSQAAEQAPERSHALFPSSQLQLPPPFSAARRNLSFAASLPSTPRVESETRNPSIAAPTFTDGSGQSSPAGQAGGLIETEHSSPASAGTLRNLASLPFRLLSAYRSRSPPQPHSGTSGSGLSFTLRKSPRREPHVAPRTQFQIYNDQLADSAQPQTPQNLPEARHQSRYHAFFTAPPGHRFETPNASRSRTTRRRGTRSDSPAGLETPGFRGLYGGRENVDDEIMFDRAARRLWALSSARISGTSIGDTSESDYH